MTMEPYIPPHGRCRIPGVRHYDPVRGETSLRAPYSCVHPSSRRDGAFASEGICDVPLQHPRPQRPHRFSEAFFRNLRWMAEIWCLGYHEASLESDADEEIRTSDSPSHSPRPIPPSGLSSPSVSRAPNSSPWMRLMEWPGRNLHQDCPAFIREAYFAGDWIVRVEPATHEHTFRILVKKEKQVLVRYFEGEMNIERARWKDRMHAEGRLLPVIRQMMV